MEILTPKTQLNLFGYENLFNSFVKLKNTNKLPNLILLSGPKGIGKATFSYHFINFLLSEDEEDKYIKEKFEINLNNHSFKLIQNNTHPNFFLLDNILGEDDIKIEQSRNLIKFLNKSTYSKDLKLILIDNSEYLNPNSSNALLKSLEEPGPNTFFFIIHNSSSSLPETIKSRCVKFKIHLDLANKKNTFKRIIQNYELNYESHQINKFLDIDTPGNCLRYLAELKDLNNDTLEDNLSCILFLIDKYKNTKNYELLNLITLLIENYYTDLSLKNIKNINYYSINKNKISYLINDMKKFNLDKKNLLITINGILKSERQ